jgi:excinuclease ABC subunit C
MAQELAYRPKTGDIPTSPGVYRFFDSTGRILYVGKAKNLRARLTSYFAPLDTLHERTRRMVTSAADVKWTTVGTEFEALQLEFTWIKEFDPPFNIQFRDDKSYPYLAITLGEKVPRVLITRKRGIAHARYFGPFTKTWAIRETLDLVLPVFPVRSCTDGVYKTAERTQRPCLLGDIGRCAAPCAGRVTVEEHRSIAIDLAHFMTGKNDEYLVRLRAQMVSASEEQNYELAAKYRDNIVALETVASKSSVVLGEGVDVDVFGLAQDDLSAAVQLFIVRDGRIRGVRAWTVDTELDIHTDELIDNMLRSAYDDGQVPARSIIVPQLPADSSEVERWLYERRSSSAEASDRGGVKLRTAVRGDLATLGVTVTTNAQQALALYKTQRSADFTTRSQALSDIQSALGLSEAPLRIECFDISHLGGTKIVASMVVFEDGLPKKADYRKFAIAQARDDTDAMNQVLARRAKYLTGVERDEHKSEGSFAYTPGLFVVDGALPQVNAASLALREAGLGHIPVVGLAKRLEELWLPGEQFPVILPRTSDALFLMQKLRDEAHRFAISFQRQSRKKDITSVLNEVPGLGPSKISALLREFGSVTHLKNADAAAIQRVPGISEKLAETIRRTLAGS